MPPMHQIVAEIATIDAPLRQEGGPRRLTSGFPAARIRRPMTATPSA